MDEYIRRNIVVAGLYGALGSARASINRLRSYKKPPLWLMESLTEIEIRTQQAIPQAIQHRDEVLKP